LTLSDERRAQIVAEQARTNVESISKAGRERRAREGSAPPRVEPPVDWRLALAKQGERYAGDERNVQLALQLAPELQRVVRWNEFALAIEVAKPAPWNAVAGRAWTDDDDVALQIWLQERSINVIRRGPVADAVALEAKKFPHHPVREYLKGLAWDHEPRLATWLSRYLGSKQYADYLASIGRAWLVGAVARVMQPGCQVDHVLVCEGRQGIGKSRTARCLAVKPAWFADDLPDIATKDGAIQLCGRWIVELGELAAIRRGEVEKVKSYLTRTVDVFRPPYGRRAVSVPRQTVFIATTNEVHYLRDRTGNRRFWPVSCEAIDLDALERDRDQLWAEAHAWYVAGTPWHLEGADAALADGEQQSRVLITELEQAVAEYLAGLDSTETTVHDVLVWGLHLDAGTPDYAERATRLGPQVAAAMRSAGWEFVERQGRGPNRRRVYRKVTTK
jgi:predicted P-loop ATPase